MKVWSLFLTVLVCAFLAGGLMAQQNVLPIRRVILYSNGVTDEIMSFDLAAKR